MAEGPQIEVDVADASGEVSGAPTGDVVIGSVSGVLMLALKLADALDRTVVFSTVVGNGSVELASSVVEALVASESVVSLVTDVDVMSSDGGAAVGSVWLVVVTAGVA